MDALLANRPNYTRPLAGKKHSEASSSDAPLHKKKRFESTHRWCVVVSSLNAAPSCAPGTWREVVLDQLRADTWDLRRSSTTVSSSNSTTVEIEECESVSLGGFQEMRETVVHRSSEKSTSSTTSLSTLSPPSPAAERSGAASPNRWGTHRVETLSRDWERVQEVTVSDASRKKIEAETKMDWLETRCEDVVTIEELKPSQIEISDTKTINDKKENSATATDSEVSSKKNEDNTPMLLQKQSNDQPKDLDVTSLKPVTELNETSLRNGYEETNVTSRDQVRSKAVEKLTSHSQKHGEERPSVRFQQNSTKDCTESQTKENLNVTAHDVPRRSPTTTPKFGSFQFPRHIDGSNVSSASLAWSYLPQLSTSHSTSSLASLRSNSGSATTSSQSPVQRRQLKSYAQRHHRSSFHVVPN
ncbi:hypothetical protein RP20_CCG025187 [Aedes albopictus]|nr:hypothetical protein RP20_CCG025187 [Aedes albopictus]